MKNRFKTMLTAILVMFVFSCSQKDNTTNVNTCNVSNPAEDLPWLKNRIGSIITSDPSRAKYQYVQQAEYRKNTVFIFGSCDPASFSTLPVYSCENKMLGNVGAIPADSLLNRTTIWKSQDSVCNL